MRRRARKPDGATRRRRQGRGSAEHKDRRSGPAGTFGVGLFLIAITFWLGIDQIRIDAHRVEVTGTISDVWHRKSVDWYYATYEYGGRVVESEPLDVPWEAHESEQLCLEIDGSKPERARPCGERMDTLTLPSLLLGSGFLIWATVERLRMMPEDSGILGRWRRKRRTSQGTTIGV